MRGYFKNKKTVFQNNTKRQTKTRAHWKKNGNCFSQKHIQPRRCLERLHWGDRNRREKDQNFWYQNETFCRKRRNRIFHINNETIFSKRIRQYHSFSLENREFESLRQRCFHGRGFFKNTKEPGVFCNTPEFWFEPDASKRWTVYQTRAVPKCGEHQEGFELQRSEKVGWNSRDAGHDRRGRADAEFV